MPEKNIQLADNFAKDYDDQVLKNKWIGPDVLFRLSKDYIQKGNNLLDLGIGTGASSLPFYLAGLKITGVDASKEMIKVCQLKGITENLFQVNLETQLLPFHDKNFDVLISNALFHLIYPIKPLFSEIERVLKNSGIFSFTFDNTSNKDGYSLKEDGIWEKFTDKGVWTCKFEKDYIAQLLKKNNFQILKEENFLAFSNKELKTDFWFTAVVAQKL